MVTRCVFALMSPVILITGCWERNPETCNAQNPMCTSPALPYCDFRINRCVAMPPTDMGFDLGPCTSSSQCTDPMSPICGAGATCRACQSAADDGECANHSSSTPRCKL